MLDTLIYVLSLSLSAFAGWAIMSRCVRDGVVIKLGLVLISVGYLGEVFLLIEPAGMRPLILSHAMVSLGLFICVAGYLMRIHKRNNRSRRLSDWVSSNNKRMHS